MTDNHLPEGTDTIIAGAGVGIDGDARTHRSPGGDGTGARARGGEGDPDDDSGAANEGGSFFDRVQGLRSEGYDKARDYAVQGKDRATGAIDELLSQINGAADQIDAKIGNHYGDYARRAAESLGGFNDALKGKDVDALFSDARALIAKAPAVAVGTAALLGFVVARLARAGLDDAGGSGDGAGTKRA